MISENRVKHWKFSYFRNRVVQECWCAERFGPFNKHDLPHTGTLLLLLLYLLLIHIYQCMLHCWPGETASNNFILQHLKLKNNNTCRS